MVGKGAKSGERGTKKQIWVFFNLLFTLFNKCFFFLSYICWTGGLKKTVRYSSNMDLNLVCCLQHVDDGDVSKPGDGKMALDHLCCIATGDR